MPTGPRRGPGSGCPPGSRPSQSTTKVGLLLWVEPARDQGKARLADKALPCRPGKEAPVARVPRLLHAVEPFLRLGIAVGNRSVDHEKVTPGPKHPRRLEDKAPHRAEMVGRDPHRHDLEGGIGKGNLLGREKDHLEGKPASPRSVRAFSSIRGERSPAVTLQPRRAS
jgi:hypothetical protein